MKNTIKHTFSLLFAAVLVLLLGCGEGPQEVPVIKITPQSCSRDQTYGTIDVNFTARNDSDYDSVMLDFYIDLDLYDNQGILSFVVNNYSDTDNNFEVGETIDVSITIYNADLDVYDVMDVHEILMDKILVYTDQDLSEPTYTSRYSGDEAVLWTFN